MARADEVTITTGDSGLQVTGRVVGYDGRLLELETDYGLLTLDYSAASCEGPACPDPANYVPLVRMSGAARMGRVMMPALIEAFGRSRGWRAEIAPGDADLLEIALSDDSGSEAARFTLRLSSTDEGFADLLALEADIVLAMRAIRPAEAAAARQVGLGDMMSPRQARIIGYDGLTPVVHPAQDRQAIALADVAGAFRGDIIDWQQIGGAQDLPITLHLGPGIEGPWQYFADDVLAATGAGPVLDVVRHASAADLATAVADTPGALGILPYGETGNARPLALQDACGFTASAQPLTLKTQDYSLTQPLFLYLPDRHPQAIIRDFLAWLRSPEAQLVVRRSGFVDQGAVPIALDAQGQRFATAITQAGQGTTLRDLQEMVTFLAPLTRMSTSFRFTEDQSQLDTVSRSKLLTLAQRILDGRFAGQTLYLIGFGNGPDVPGAGSAGALGRAERVRDGLLGVLGADEALSATLKVAAFDEALPMGCTDTPWGQHRNRRVELWVDQR